MPVVRLKGLNKNTKRLADGRTVTYWYAWKGGPKLNGQPGSPEFVAGYNAAIASRKAPRGHTLATLVALYKAAPEWIDKTAPSTKKEWARFLDLICQDKTELDIGGLPYDALDDRRIRKDILEWRDQWSATPRKADYAIQVLARVLSFGVDRGILDRNIAAGISQLYESNRADQIWTEDEEAAYLASAPSVEVGFIISLANRTGFRREDLARLDWADVGEIAIVLQTGKSRGRKTVVVPILPDTRILLDKIKAHQAAQQALRLAKAVKAKQPPPDAPTAVLTNTRGKRWTVNGLEHQVIDTKTKAGVNKHLHDARGTFATRLRKAGLKASEIADIVGWEEKRVERLLATYVDQNSIVMDLAARLNRNEP